MPWPRSNNLRGHLKWAQDSFAFKPKTEEINSVAKKESTIESDEALASSDSDFEFLAQMNKPSEEANASPIFVLSSSPDSNISKSPLRSSLRSPLHTPQHSPVHSPVHSPLLQQSSPIMSQLVSYAPLDSAPAGPEIGSIFSEKIALLERKISVLQSALSRAGVNCSTAEVDFSLKEVEHRINQFADAEVIDIHSSPSSYGSPVVPGIRHNVFNDDFDDEPVVCDVRQKTISPARGPNSDSESETQPVSTTSGLAPLVLKEVMHTLRTRFGLNGFRSNQLEAVTETLSGRDVVVLMPTGGGKSLCYQLPALIRSGTSSGTTIVISPLISLMQDQVYHLKNRNIQAEMLNSRLNSVERSEVFAKLRDGMLQLLYISPEMLSISATMRSALESLHRQNKLARIVIDEAHCVSSWGHDFRPEYMQLSEVKENFPNTPIMALTATANERVLLDIVNCLRADPTVLRQSFNRPNLFYEVRQKTNKALNEVAALCRQFSGKSGIMYCNSKRNCEESAAKLAEMGINASYYHAGMEAEDRARVQIEWQQGKSQIVCATIAFGMGIDKPDVRFVVHLTLPRNVEGYYQETGRAGRDGRPAKCILFYTYRDVQLLQNLISQDTQNSHQIREHHRQLLVRVMQYCENSTDCRRKQVLQYFNEEFDPANCRYQCDNCRRMSGQVAIRKDMTSQARKVVEIVSQISNTNLTTQQLIDICIGRVSSKVKSCGFNKNDWFGALKGLGLGVVERLAHTLLSERVLQEFSKYNRSRYPQTYVKLGSNAQRVSSGCMAIQLVMSEDDPSAFKRRAL